MIREAETWVVVQEGRDVLVRLLTAPAEVGREAPLTHPRATLGLTVCARVSAFMAGRPYVTPQDVKSVALNVMRHRVLLTYEAEAEELSPEDVVGRILDGVKVP